MKYVFLTFSMGGLSGSPSYVSNKVKWLNERGIETVVFDHYGSLNMGKEIALENLLPYNGNRLLELFFPPGYFSKKQRKHILERLIATIGASDDYVVESNSTRLALWGEMLAEKLHAKHLVLNIGEQVFIHNDGEFRFLEYKLTRQELFGIKPKAIQSLFRWYKEISDEDAKELYFSASMGVTPEDVPMHELDDLPEAKYKILSFGRYKPYFINMIKGVVDFAHNHQNERINFLFMGEVVLPKEVEALLGKENNLYVKYIPAQRPIPKVVFDCSDVVIATAGCANISYKAGAKTISMNVNSCLPLGVMGYTTVDSVFSTNPEQPLYNICDLLEDVMVRRLYDGEPRLVKKPSSKGYKFQWGLINNDRQYWPKVDKITMENGFKRIAETVALRCGGIRLLADLAKR